VTAPILRSDRPTLLLWASQPRIQAMTEEEREEAARLELRICEQVCPTCHGSRRYGFWACHGCNAQGTVSVLQVKALA
jgi:mono/diheme cytochrome c family protein